MTSIYGKIPVHKLYDYIVAPYGLGIDTHCFMKQFI